MTGLQITNEVNIAYSKNTSDGFYKRAVEALVRGVIEAKRDVAAARIRPPGDRLQLRLPLRRRPARRRFWRAVGRRGGARLRRPPTGSASTSTRAPSSPGVLLRRRSPTTATPSWRGSPRFASATCPRPGSALHAAAHRGDRLPHRPGPLGGRPAEGHARVRQDGGPLPGHLRHQRLPLVRPARQQQRGTELPAFFGLLRDDYCPSPPSATTAALIARYGGRHR